MLCAGRASVGKPPVMTLTAKTRLGHTGESIARGFLERAGLTFVAANWRCQTGELDLVMREEATLVFVEVKVRRGERAGRAEESVSAAQARRIIRSAEWFIGEHPAYTDLIWRVDLVAITLSAT